MATQTYLLINETAVNCYIVALTEKQPGVSLKVLLSPCGGVFMFVVCVETPFFPTVMNIV